MKPPLIRISSLYLLLLLAACGGGDKQGSAGSAARELSDPRTVPTATAPATLPTTIAAIDLSAPQRRATALPDVYVVKPGDTPAAIAQELGVDLDELLRANSITDPRSLKVGQTLKVPRPATASATPTRTGPAAPTRPPAPGSTPAPTAAATRAATATATTVAGAGGSYTVEAGDTACEIAVKLGVALTALAETNGVTVAQLAALRIGQVLKVPSTKGPPGC
jgi:LysM repeat protein